MKKLLFIVLSIMIGTFGLVIPDSTAQNTPDVHVSLALNQSTYAPNDAIEIVMNLANTGTIDVITSKGFSDTDFYLYLIFIDPDGQVITSNKLTETNTLTPPPPRVFVEDGHLLQGELVETLIDGWKVSFRFDARNYYPLPDKGGLYTVKALIPMRAYPQTCLRPIGSGTDAYSPIKCDGIWYGAIESTAVSYTQIADADGDAYFYPVPLPGDPKTPDCNDSNPSVHPGAVEILANGLDDDCNPATPDVQTATTETGTIMIQADKHTVGSGSHPGSTKAPLTPLPVRIYDKSTGSCAAGFGISWQNYMSIWLSCPPQLNGVGLTEDDGTVSLEVIPGDYLLIGKYDPDDSPQSGDEIFVGCSVGNVGPKQVKKDYLQLIVKADNSLVPAKYTKKTGSELLVIEPEYIEWDGTQELYPFVFDSVGDWSVSTSVSPPEGFVADNNTLSEEVTSEVEAVQFTITDIGSKWVSTGVLHKVKHKNKAETIQSKIGIKLTKILAEEKGVSIWGEDDQGENQDDQGQDQGKGKKK